MSTHYLRGYVERAAGKPGSPIRFAIATEGRKADGIDLRMDRVDLERFRANPVVMYGHQYWGREALPIGRADDVFVDGPRLMADTVFDIDDPFAADVDRKYRNRFLNAVSVGFDVHGIDDATGIPDSWELLEYSAVPIPLDPEALADDGRQAIRSLRGFVERSQADPIRPHAARAVDVDGWTPPADLGAADRTALRAVHAWVDPDGDPDDLRSYRFAHHDLGDDAPAQLAAVRDALARLEETALPPAARDTVEAHLLRHLTADVVDTDADGIARPRLLAARQRLVAI